MARFAKFLAAAALASSFGAPATAQQPYQPQYPQPYPEPQPYQQQPYQQPYGQQGYGNDQQYGTTQNPFGAIIDSLIGNRYNVSDRQAIHQCAYAAVERARTWNWGNGWQQPYPGYTNNMRVLSITDVQRRSSSVRVRGEMGRNWRGNQGYNPNYPNQPYDPRYGYGGGGYGRPELSFRCDVDYQGYVRNVRIEPLYRAY